MLAEGRQVLTETVDLGDRERDTASVVGHFPEGGGVGQGGWRKELVLHTCWGGRLAGGTATGQW